MSPTASDELSARNRRGGDSRSMDLSRTRRFCYLSLAMASLSLVAVLSLRSRITSPGSLDIFFHLLVVYDGPAALLSLLILLASIGLPSTRLPGRFALCLATRPVAAAILVFLTLCIASCYVYHSHPLAMDEYAPLFQSKLFAAGRMVGRYPPELLDRLVPRGFQNYFLVVSRRTGQVVSAYWPGFSLLLAPFSKLGIPWACNPLLATASLILLRRIAAQLFEDRDASGWVVLLALASPAFVVNAISYYSMTAHLFVNLLFALLLLRPRAWRLLAAGFVGSWALVLHNPLPHTLFAIPWLIGIARGERRLRNLAIIAAGYIPVSLVCGVGWVMLKLMILDQDGLDPRLPLAAGSASSAHALPLSESFSLPTLDVIQFRLIGLIKMLIWDSPGLLALALIGYERHSRRVPLKIMAASGLLTFAGYFFVPFSQGHGWGYRYFHSAWGVLPLLATAAFVPRSESDADSRRLSAIAGTAAILSLVLATSLRFYQVHGFIENHLRQLPEHDPRARQIIFIDVHRGYYSGDLVQNDPLLRDATLVLASHGEQNDEQLVRQLFHRPVRERYYRLGTVWSAGKPSGGSKPCCGEDRD